MTTPPDPLDYAGAPAPPPPAQGAARPTSVTVLAIIGIVIGGIGLLCKPLGLLGMLVRVPHPVLDAIRNDAFVRGWMVVTVGTGWLISLLLLLSAVGSLGLRDWGRSGILAYATLAILSTLVERSVELRVIEPALAPAVRQVTAQQPAASRFQLSGQRGYAIRVTGGLIYPAFILVFFNRRHVKRAFEEGPGTGGSGI